MFFSGCWWLLEVGDGWVNIFQDCSSLLVIVGSSGKKYMGYMFKTSHFSTIVAGIPNIQII